MMASHNFDNQNPVIFDRHPQSSPPVASASKFIINPTSPLVFAQPTVPYKLRHCSDGHQARPPVLQPMLRCPHPHTEREHIIVDGQPQSAETIQNLISRLKHEVALRDDQISRMATEIESLRRLVGDRNRDVDQLKSVLDQKFVSIATQHSNIDTNNGSGCAQNVCEPIMEADDVYMTPAPNLSIRSPPLSCVAKRVKKQGVSGESVSRNVNIGFIHYEKDQASRRLIYNAIIRNDFLNNLERDQIEKIVLCMYRKRVKKDCFVIREGEPGDALYVTAHGVVEVLKGGQILAQMGTGRAFGEMALLYNCNRTASIKALTDAEFWTLDRRVYQQIMMNSSLHKHKENLKFLMSVSTFKNLSQTKLHKLADVLELIYYPGKEYIIRQGEVGETFFIIHSGQVQVTQSKTPGEIPQQIRVLGAGDWFGERALCTKEKRSANVVAMPPGVHVLSLDRSNFIHLIEDLSEIKLREYEDSNCDDRRFSSIADGGVLVSGDDRHELDCHSSRDAELLDLCPFSSTALDSMMETSVADELNATAEGSSRLSFEQQTIKYEDLTSVAILGVGGFGRVELVVWKHDPVKSFALKCMKKQHIVQTRQQEHIFSERNLMFEIRSPFVCRLYATYRDNKYVYMLLEACLGGEIWTILRNRGNFDDHISRFIVASVLEAFTYLHTHNIIYRDLKPENLLLDPRGYIKLCDFGFAKKISPGRKTWTFCGTPEYVAPEIILNKGHDHSADYWSLGILMFELLTGSPPFTGMDPMKIYNIILRGIDAIMFPPFHINRTATALIHRLCAQNPVERLGYGRGGIVDIKQHKYFQGFDWIGLCRGTLQAPILPKIFGPTDVSNFDRYPNQMEVPPDELSGWDAEF